MAHESLLSFGPCDSIPGGKHEQQLMIIIILNAIRETRLPDPIITGGSLLRALCGLA